MRTTRTTVSLAVRTCRAALILCGVVAPVLATGCASSGAGDAPPEGYVQAAELLAPLGLRELPRESSGRVVLQGPRGERVALFPGSNSVTVRGRRVDTLRPVEYAAERAWVERNDGARIRRAWTANMVRRGPQTPVVVVPPRPVYRPTSPSPTLPPRPGNMSLPPPTPHPPAVDPGPAATTGSNAPTRAEIAAWGVQLRRRWSYIVLHHSATASGSAASFGKEHRDRGWDGLGYDFVIGNGKGSPDGRVEVGYRWQQQKRGAHAGNDLMNERGIGICLVGDFTKTRPTAAQMRSLERLCGFLSAYCGIGPQNLRRHGDFRETACPGTLFPRSFAFRPAPGVRRGSVAAR